MRRWRSNLFSRRNSTMSRRIIRIASAILCLLMMLGTIRVWRLSYHPVAPPSDWLPLFNETPRSITWHRSPTAIWSIAIFRGRMILDHQLSTPISASVHARIEDYGLFRAEEDG